MPAPRPRDANWSEVMANWTHRSARSSSRAAAAALTVLLAFGAALPAARAADGGAALLAEARTKIRKKDVRGALTALERAIAANPSDADAHMLYQDVAREALGVESLVTSYRQKSGQAPDDALLAFLYLRLLPPDEALKGFEKMITQHAGSPWAHAGKARALEALGRGAEATASYDAAVAAAPKETRFRAYQAFGYERAGNWAAAADAWNLVLTAAPTDRAARLGLGECLRKTGAFEGAIAEFTTVLKADASDAEAHYRIGLTHLDSGHADESLKSLDTALQIERTFVEAYCAATEAAIKRALDTAEKEKRDPQEKDFEKALAYGAKAAAVGPDRPDAHFAYASAHESAGEFAVTHYEAALVEYDAALNLLVQPTPEKVRALCGRSFVLLRLQKWDQALAAADKALGIDPKCVAAYAHGGFALAAQGRQDDAIKNYYRPGLKIAPDDARLHHATGVALWETVHTAEAKKELEAAVKADPKNPRYRLTLGQLYYELEMYPKAGEQLVEVVEARPNDIEAWRSYGRVCCRAGDWAQAVESYEKIVSLLETPPAPPPPAGGNAPANGAPAASGPQDDDLLKKAHLYLAIIYADHIKKRDKAKEHARKFTDLGGTDQNLQAFLTDLLGDK
jgi:tetratricopeptide (TPR) repeat protein